MAKIRYSRVSTEDQNLDRQEDYMKVIGVDRIFSEKRSGKNRERSELKAMMAFVREGDVLYIESLSRLGRSVSDLLYIIETLRAKGVEVVSQKESIDTSTPTGRFIITVFSALSELERESTLLRQREGIAAAKRKGKHLGRPKMVLPKNWGKVYERYSSGNLRAVDAQKELGMKPSTFYKAVSQIRDLK